MQTNIFFKMSNIKYASKLKLKAVFLISMENIMNKNISL